MKVALLSASLAAVLSLTMVAEAAAWTRNSTVTTPRGTYSHNVTGTCSGGACARSGSVTGPYGGTVSRTGTVTRTGPSSYSYSRTTTGPYGNSVTRSGTVQVSPYAPY
jgi:hypothetical protein